MLNSFFKVLNKIKKEGLFKKGDKIILACSGGPDSVALLDILSRLKSLNLKITVVYFNHQLRLKEVKKEKAYIQNLCHRYSLPFVYGEGQVRNFARRNKLSVQEAGRHLRYEFLFKLGKKLKIRKIVLGHHRDDSVETILLGILKGTGLRGLSGIESLRERGNFLLIRPLMDLSKKEIVAYLRQRNIRPCLDSSNLKETYLRNRLRLKVMPYLRRHINPKVDEAILRLSRIYSQENDFLEKAMARNMKKAIFKKDDRIHIRRLNFLKCHPGLGNRFLKEMLSQIGLAGEGSIFRRVEIISDFISSAHPGQRLHFASGYVVAAGAGDIIIGKKGSASKVKIKVDRGRRPYKLHRPGVTVIKDLNLKFKARFSGKIPSLREIKEAFPRKVFFDADKITSSLYIRFRSPGDYFQPLGMDKAFKLKKYFIKAKVPREERAIIPLVISAGKIIWVAGKAISDTVKVTAGTQKVLVLEVIKMI